MTYFSKATGVPVPCSFEIYNYGPYSDRITFAVDSLLADELLVDASTNPSKYSSYRLASQRLGFPEEIEKQVRPHRSQIERVVESLGGFRPEQLELIATLHFLADKRRSQVGKRPLKAEVVRDFVRVKADKFKRAEVEGWYDALERAKLV